MDFGPYMLGSGTQFSVLNFKNNVRPYIKLALKKKIKFLKHNICKITLTCNLLLTINKRG